MVKVYVKVDSDSLITEVNSEIFMESIDGYALIDEGEGDRFTHAQGNYLESGQLQTAGWKCCTIDRRGKTRAFPAYRAGIVRAGKIQCCCPA